MSFKTDVINNVAEPPFRRPRFQEGHRRAQVGQRRRQSQDLNGQMEIPITQYPRNSGLFYTLVLVVLSSIK